jgi:hypothetical protein
LQRAFDFAINSLVLEDLAQCVNPSLRSTPLRPPNDSSKDIEQLRVAAQAPRRALAVTFKINHLLERLGQLFTFNRPGRAGRLHVMSPVACRIR